MMGDPLDLDAISERWAGFAYDRGSTWADLESHRSDVPALVARVRELEGERESRHAETPRPVMDRLVSPNAFDGRGPVPDKVTAAARHIARLRVKFINQWVPGCESPLTTREVEQLFGAAAIQAEWMRELYEALHPTQSPEEEE